MSDLFLIYSRHGSTIVFANTQKKDIIRSIFLYFSTMSKYKNISGSPKSVPNVGTFETDETRDLSPDLDQYFTNSPHFEKVEKEVKKGTADLRNVAE